MNKLLTTLLLLLVGGNCFAATFYVRSTDGDNGDNGSTWALAKATLAGAFTAAAAGDTIYVSDNHAETQASAMTLTCPGTAASPCRIICVDDSAEPPTAQATTATVTTTGNSAITFTGAFYYYGHSFFMGSGAVAPVMTLGTVNLNQKFESCNFNIVATGASYFNLSTGIIEWVNCSTSFGATGQLIYSTALFNWVNSTAITGATIPNALINALGSARTFNCVGVDFSSIGSGKNLVSFAAGSVTTVRLRDCKLGASVGITTGAALPDSEVRLVNCDATDTNYRYHLQTYQGTITHETIIVRTGGASDGTTTVSRKMVSTANAKFYSTLQSDPVLKWNETVGSSVSVTIAVVTDNVTLTDAEAWVEVEYLGTSGFPLSSTISDRAVNVLATPANQTTDGTATWTTTGLTTPVKQSLSVTFTPQEKGLIRARVMLAKASTTMYFDPKLTIQ